MTINPRNSFDTLDRAWARTLEDVLTCGSHIDCRNGGSTEAVGVDFTVLNINSRLLMNKRRALKRYYASAELLWYLSGSDDVKYLLDYAPSYARFADADGKAYGAYGPRLFNCPDNRNSILYAFNMLNQSPATRQCVVSIWQPYDLVTAYDATSKDIPCTLNLQFFVRDEALHLIVNMRSNDMWLGTPYDCFCFMSIQSIMASALGIKPGFYRHCVGSMHIYTSNIKAAVQAIDSFKEECKVKPINEHQLPENKARSILYRSYDFDSTTTKSFDWIDDLTLSTRQHTEHLGRHYEFSNNAFKEL